jgi:type VI secretion system protein ImpK
MRYRTRPPRSTWPASTSTGSGHEVQQFGKVCATLQLPPPQVDKARYCMCSALDEAAALTGWGNGTATGMEWETNGLASIFGYDRQGCDRV